MTPSSYIRDNLKITRNFYNFGNEFLEKLIDWIGYVFEPDDVYTQEQLKDWFTVNFDFTEVTESKDILDYVRKKFNPEEVFSEKELNEWAVEHNYEKL